MAIKSAKYLKGTVNCFQLAFTTKSTKHCCMRTLLTTTTEWRTTRV